MNKNVVICISASSKEKLLTELKEIVKTVEESDFSYSSGSEDFDDGTNSTIDYFDEASIKFTEEVQVMLNALFMSVCKKL